MSSLILENLIKQKSKINFDFSKSFKSNQGLNENFNYDVHDLPILPNEKVNWNEIHHNEKSYFGKEYAFKDNDHILYFIKEVLNLKSNSDVEIFLKNNYVKVYIASSHSIELTGQEISLSKVIDEIFEDIFYF